MTSADKPRDLVWSRHDRPGITRHRAGKTFIYRGADNRLIRDKAVLHRIKSLVIPPAWNDVWIAPAENGHIQAVGVDARGRKQYRYHARWREVRDEAKYERLLAFAEVLPAVRRRVTRALSARGMSREKVLATVVRLLEVTLIRVGNEEYAQSNRSYGLTTLRNRHVKVRGARVEFNFVGKSGKKHRIAVSDPRLARIVRRCQDLPGQELFGYVDESGAVQSVSSSDVNDFLREQTGHEFTAKDFRTWAGSVLAAVALRECARADSPTAAQRSIRTAIAAVAQVLGNTPAVCRKCYVHPEILAAYVDGRLIGQDPPAATRRTPYLRADEAEVLRLLRGRLKKGRRHAQTTAGSAGCEPRLP